MTAGARRTRPSGRGSRSSKLGLDAKLTIAAGMLAVIGLLVLAGSVVWFFMTHDRQKPWLTKEQAAAERREEARPLPGLVRSGLPGWRFDSTGRIITDGSKDTATATGAGDEEIKKSMKGGASAR